MGERVAGLVLAAGAGRRMGAAKALVRDEHGTTWVARTARALCDAGCRPVVVVIGAQADEVRRELSNGPDRGVELVEATDWAEGMGASLRSGLRRLTGYAEPVGVVIVPVDVPGVTADAVRRVAGRADPAALVRATYGGAPGHPVLIGRDHWSAVVEDARGEVGARHYLERHEAVDVECADLADGRDVDTPSGLPAGHSVGNEGTAGSC